MEVRNSINKLSAKLFILYLLNCSDLLFTFTLLKTRDFYEVNPLMLKIVNIPLLSIAIKVIIPGLVFIYLFKMLDNDRLPVSSFVQHLSSLVVLIYLVINITHIYLSISYIF